MYFCWLWESVAALLKFYFGSPFYPRSISQETYLPNVEIRNRPLNLHYDYVIVGGGSAGCVLANRLSADPNRTVLLIEAGESEIASMICPWNKVLSFKTKVPLFAPALMGTKMNWEYLPVPQKNACLSVVNNVCPWAKGKALGGSSAINFMLYVRGNPRDYDDWRNKFGAEGWAYEDVLHHFKSIEKTMIPNASEQYRGTSGEIPVTYPNYETDLPGKFLRGCEQLEYDIIDYNGESQEGCSKVQTNTYNGERQSAAKVFIDPVLHRENLHVALKSHVTKVLIDGEKRATGVSFSFGGATFNITATREVIISAGAVGSPQLLLLSGIGPKQDLEKMQIPVVIDLPVGENLQDHVHIDGVAGKLPSPHGIGLFNLPLVFDWRSGPASIPGTIEALAFVSTKFVDASLKFPDVQISLQSIATTHPLFRVYLELMGFRQDVIDQYYLSARNDFGFALAPVMNRPESRGFVKLSTTDPFDQPIIDPRYMTHPQDIKVAVEGVKIALDLMRSDPMRSIGAEPWSIPLKACALKGPIWSDAYLTCFVKHMAHTTWHACCTCPMGNDRRAVVNHELKVWGVQKLRVVDASVMPTIVTGNLNVPTLMIAQKAAAMIRDADP
uniref:Putative glucose dehydrogenase ovary overexpressed n=1 Tax=Rhipicephalus microplus TaxID=6941 RepID=A0A6M2D3Z6_RHIMP